MGTKASKEKDKVGPKDKAKKPSKESLSPSSSSTNVAAAVGSGSTGGTARNLSSSTASENGTSPRGADKDDAHSNSDVLTQEIIYSRDETKATPDDFELQTVIGKGSFGKVMQVRKKDDGRIFAMKVLRKESIIARQQVAHTMAERNILRKIQHPFIVTLHYAFQTEEKLYMILDYVNGGELFFHLKKEGKFSEERVKFYAAQITMALQHLHSLGVVYRDLKPENILLDSDGNIVLTDFGLSKEITDEKGAVTFCGTPEYLAPEVLKGQGHGTAVDWWSLGTLIYEMLTGLPPFYCQNVNIMYQKILNGELRMPNTISPEAQSLLLGHLNRDPKKRLGANGVEEIRTHPFYSGINWEDLYAKKIPTPFRPKVKSAADVSQIDPVFTQEAAIDSLVDSNLGNVNTNEFQNFTFTAPTALDAAS